MKAIILAAGYATRLHPLTIDTPKPLLPIGRRKMVDWIIDKLSNVKAVDAIYIVTNERFFGKFEEWLKRSRHKGNISIINDGTATNDTRLGAIKDMEIAIDKKKIDDDILVVAGDNLFDMDMENFLASARSNPSSVCIALYDIKDLKAASKFGVLILAGDKTIVDFEEKPKAPKSTLVSTGIYYFPREKVGAIKEYIVSPGARSDQPGYYISWMCKREKVYGFPFKEDWCDIGDIESYKIANERYLTKEKR